MPNSVLESPQASTAAPANEPARTTDDVELFNVGAQITSGAAQMLAAQALNVPLGVLTNALLTRTLGPEMFGLYVLIGSIGAWFEVFGVRTLSRTSVRLIATADDWKNTASQFLQIHFLVGIAEGVILFLTAPLIAAALSAPALTPYLRIATLELPIAALMRLQESTLIGQKHFGGRARIMAAHGLIRLALVFWLLQNGLSLTGALVADVGAVAGQFLIARWLLPVPIAFHRSMPWRAIGSYAVPLFLYTIAISLYQNLDILLVKLLQANPEATGFYGAAETLMSMSGMISVAIAPLLLAVLAGLWHKGNRQGAGVVITQAVRLHLIILPFITLAAGSAREIIQFLYGDAYLPAAPIMAWLVFAGLATMLHSMITSCLTAIGEPRLTFWVTAPMLPCLVILALITNPTLGSVGIAMSSTIVITTGGVCAIVVLVRKSNARLPWSSLIRMGFISAGVYWLGRFSEAAWPATGPALIAKLAGLCLLVAVMLFLSFEVRLSELRFVMAIVSRLLPSIKQIFDTTP